MSAHSPEVIAATVKAVRKVTMKVPCPGDREIALAILDDVAPRIIAGERERIRQGLREQIIDALANITVKIPTEGPMANRIVADDLVDAVLSQVDLLRKETR